MARLPVPNRARVEPVDGPENRDCQDNRPDRKNWKCAKDNERGDQEQCGQDYSKSDRPGFSVHGAIGGRVAFLGAAPPAHKGVVVNRLHAKGTSRHGRLLMSQAVASRRGADAPPFTALVCFASLSKAS